MGGSWIVVGACLLGVVSILLIAGSLWASSSARKRPRPASLVSGSYPPFPVVHSVPNPTPIAPGFAAPPTADRTLITAPPSPFVMPSDPPVDQATQFLTVDDIFALADDRVEPTRILDPEQLLGHDAPPAEPVPPAPVPVAPRVVWAPAAAIPAVQTPAASIPRPQPSPAASTPAPAPAPSKYAPPDPAAFVKPPVDAPSTPYVGFVAPRSPGHDDDDDDDDDDPETELVHQAELLALMIKSRPPG